MNINILILSILNPLLCNPFKIKPEEGNIICFLGPVVLIRAGDLIAFSIVSSQKFATTPISSTKAHTFQNFIIKSKRIISN